MLKVSAEAHPVVNIRTSEHHIPSRLSVRMFGSWGKKRANASSNCAATGLLRGDYTRLAAQNFCELDRIAAASDAELLACLDKDTVKLRLVREAGDAMAAKRKSQTQSHGPILEAYVA